MSQLNVLHRLSSLLDQESRMVIFRAFIVSNVNYCPLVWHFKGKTNTSKIEKLQKWALRFVFNDFTSSYDNMLEKAELTTLTLFRITTLALEVYKALHGHSPPTSSSSSASVQGSVLLLHYRTLHERYVHIKTRTNTLIQTHTSITHTI